MSYYKCDYKCDCGVNYGDCGAECAWIVAHNRTVDVYHLYHTDGHYWPDKPETKNPRTVEVDVMGDASLNALLKVLSSNENVAGSAFTEEQKSVIFGLKKE